MKEVSKITREASKVLNEIRNKIVKEGGKDVDKLQLSEKVKGSLEQLTGLKTSSVIGLAQEDEMWVVTLELVEKESIPDAMDILGTYEVKADGEGNIIDFIRTKLRKRGDTVEV